MIDNITVTEIKEFYLSGYSLPDLLLANKMVKSSNKKKEKLQKYHSSKGHKTKGISIKMTLADRYIAAVYTALNFLPNGEMIALINDIGVGCVKADYKTKED